MWEPNKYRFFQLNTWNIVIFYLLLGFLWILFSDRLLEQAMDDPATLTQLQTIKGWFYVMITGVLLFVLINRHTTRIGRMRTEFIERFDLYRTLLEQGNQVVIQVDEHQHFSYANSAVRDILGYNDSELQTMHDIEALVHPNDRSRFGELRKSYDIKQKDHEPIKKRIRLRHKNESWRWYFLILTDKRSFEHIESRLLLVRDIHDETTLFEQLNEAHSRLSYHIQNTPLGFVEWDADMRVMEWSSESEQIFGWKREEVVGLLTGEWTMVYSDDAQFVMKRMKNMLQGKELRNVISNRNYTKEGDVLHCEWYNSALLDRDGRLVSIMSLVHDITKRINAQEDLKKLNALLEEKVRQRTRELELVNQELESFAYSVSHDLRAPLRGIDGFSQVLLEKYAGQLDDQGMEYLNRVRQASQRMGNLIDDILGLSRISRVNIKMERVDLAALGREIIESLQEKEPERKVNFSAPEELLVTGDTSLLRVMMQNLLENAWKYSATRKLAEIEIGYREEGKDDNGHEENGNEENGHVTVYVRDNGVGFSMKYHDKLFMPFQRLHTQDEFQGTGIGLATVQRIVYRHSGSIHAESKENGGADFIFKLPDKSV